MNAIRAKVSETGRLSLPADIRKLVGLERGGDVIIELDGQDIHIRTVAEVVARAQALSRDLLARKKHGGVDRFLADRRAETDGE